MDGGRTSQYARTLEKNHNANAKSGWESIMLLSILICVLCLIVGFSFLMAGDKRGSTYSATWIIATITGVMSFVSYYMAKSMPN